MTSPIQVTFRHMRPSAFVVGKVSAEARKLQRYYDRITSCHVVIEAPHHHHKRGSPFRVIVELAVPRREIVVDHAPRRPHFEPALDGNGSLHKRDERIAAHKHITLTIHDAFKAARRRLEDHVRCLRGDVKTHAGANGDNFELFTAG